VAAILSFLLKQTKRGRGGHRRIGPPKKEKEGRGANHEAGERPSPPYSTSRERRRGKPGENAGTADREGERGDRLYSTVQRRRTELGRLLLLPRRKSQIRKGRKK